MEQEQWRDVVGYEGLYEVSNYGRVRSLDRVVPCRGGGLRNHRGKMISVYVDTKGDGYACTSICKHGACKKVSVHVLVLSAFVGPRPTAYDACHNDGDRTNARLDNLRWGTKTSNQADKVAHRTVAYGERHCHAVLSNEVAQWVRESHQSSLALAPILGVASSTIRAIRTGQNRSNGND